MTDKCKTVNKTVTIRSDIYKQLSDMIKNSEYEGFFYIRMSTLITLVLEWAFEHGVNDKDILRLYADACFSESGYARTPMRTFNDVNSKKDFERELLKKR